jgi:hypothetical protein
MWSQNLREFTKKDHRGTPRTKRYLLLHLHLSFREPKDVHAIPLGEMKISCDEDEKGFRKSLAELLG